MHQGNAQQTTNDSNLITLHICTARLHNFFNSARTLSEQPALGLGVIIDDKLKWDAHISHLETRLLSSITMIKRIRKLIPRRFYNQLYYSLFQSYLVFGISAWGGACSSKLVKVFALQKRCIRLLFGSVWRNPTGEI